MMQVMNVPSLKDHMQLWSEDEPPKSEPMEPQTPQKDLRSNKKTTEDSSPLDQSSNPGETIISTRNNVYKSP